MPLAKIVNGVVEQYPYTMYDLRRDNPNTSFPQDMTDEGLMSWNVYQVVLENVPQYNNNTHRLSKRSTPEYVDGQWRIQWDVVPLTEQELAMRELQLSEEARSMRNNLLAETDWIVVKYAETGTAVPEEWQTYRQALRDLPSSDLWPQPVWPQKPTSV